MLAAEACEPVEALIATQREIRRARSVHFKQKRAKSCRPWPLLRVEGYASFMRLVAGGLELKKALRHGGRRASGNRSSRGDRTAIELLVAGVSVWEARLQRSVGRFTDGNRGGSPYLR